MKPLLWNTPDFKPVDKVVIGITYRSKPILVTYSKDHNAWLECESDGRLKFTSDGSPIYVNVELWTPMP